MVGVTLTIAIPGAREGGGGLSAILKSGLLFLYIIINVQGPKQQHRGVLQGLLAVHTHTAYAKLSSQYVGVMLSCKLNYAH
jgi:hypothetical protein